MQHELITLENKKNSELVVIMTKEGGDNTLERIVAQIALDANSLVFDANTRKGLDGIKSNAYGVKQKKAAILKAGKDLTLDLKAIPNLIIESMKQVELELDYVADMVRMPLTHHEALIENKKRDDDKEADRLAEIARIEDERIENERLFALLWDEAHVMNDRFDIDKEKAEIAKTKQAEQDEKDRLAREAELIEQGRLAAEQASKDALAKAEREKLEAEQREQQAVENARIAKENAELVEKQRLIDAENARVAELEKAERDPCNAGRNLENVMPENNEKNVEKTKQLEEFLDAGPKPLDNEHRYSEFMRILEEVYGVVCVPNDIDYLIEKAKPIIEIDNVIVPCAEYEHLLIERTIPPSLPHNYVAVDRAEYERLLWLTTSHPIFISNDGKNWVQAYFDPEQVLDAGKETKL